MAPLTKIAARILRWAVGRSDTALPPWIVDRIQQGALGYSYKSVPLLKNPFDLAIYGLLISRLRPRTIIEIGTYRGGAAMWFADQLALHGIAGTVHSLDVVAVEMPPHPHVVLWRGDARALDAVFPEAWIAEQPRPLLVVDDGDHTRSSVLSVLEHFGPRMRPGEYIIIEDGIVGDLGIAHKMDGGPVRAVHEYLARGAPFEIDRSCCDFFGRNLTWNVDGYLRRQ